MKKSFFTTIIFLWSAVFLSLQAQDCSAPAAPYVQWSGCDKSGVNLTGVNMTGANLTDANLTNANLSGTVLSGANLTGANLTGANLTGVVSGDIIGAPSALPAGWQLVNGYLATSLTATQSQVNTFCNGGCNGSATVVASGGVAPYTYSWSPSGGTRATASDLCAFTYTCTITDRASSTITKTFNISQPSAIAVSVASQTNVSCNGGSNGAASINTPTGGTPGYTYNWTPGNPTGDGTRSVTGLSAGTWTCTVTDNNGCTKTRAVLIETLNTSSTPITAVSVPSSNCPYTNVTLTASGGISGTGSIIKWYSSPNGTGTLLGTGNSIIVSPTGTSTYYVRREGLCNTTADFSVVVNVKSFSYATETITACGSYEWHGNTYTASNNAATWTGTNAAGCDSIVTLNLTITPFTVNTTTIAACDSYTWPVNGQTYTTSGTHTVSAGETVFFNSLSGLTSAVSAAGYTLSDTQTFESYSTGGQGTLTGSFGQGSLSWTASAIPNGSFTQPSGGSMTLSTFSPVPLTISFNPGVTSVGANFFVTGYQQQGPDVFPTLSGTITLTLSDGSTQSFYTNTANSFGGFVSHGAYITSIIITTSNDYVSVDNLVVSTGTINACVSEELNLTINHPSSSTETIVACGSYEWHGTTYTTSNNIATWTGTNAAGCDSIVTLNLTINQPSYTTEPIVACGSCEWHGNTYTSSNNTATWTGTNAAGCDSIVTLNLTINSAPTATITGNTTFCAGGNTVLTANATSGGGGSVMATAAGGIHSLFLKNDGTVWATGNNEVGQLGDETYVNKNTPVQVSGLSGITAIAAGYTHSLFLKNDGTVWATGANEVGQLGDETFVTKNTAVQVRGLIGIMAISAGNGHSLFLKNDGTVWATGYNFGGQLGDGTYVNKNTPVQVSGLSGIMAISAGDGHSLFLKNDGTVWATGYNFGGQLGDGTYVKKNTPVQVSGLSGIMAISAGNGHSLFLKNDSTVVATGNNNYGQFGDGTYVSQSIPVEVSALSGIKAMAAGTFHSLFLKNDSTVCATGWNYYGQLGDETYVNKNAPVQVSGLSGTTAIAAGYNHSLFLKNDGTVRATGWNDFGQLGDGTYVTKNTPVPVSGFDVTITSYQWKLNGSEIAGATNASYTATAAGNYTVVVTNSNGCSTSESVTVVVNEPSYTTETIVACGSYNWHGTTYTSSTNNTGGIFGAGAGNLPTWTGTNAAGCDSIVTLDLTITPFTVNTTTIAACDSYTWPVNGQSYTASGTHIVNAGETVFFNSLSGLTSAVSAAGYTLSATETFESYSSGPQGTLTGSFGQGSLSWTASSTANGSYTQPSGGSMALSTNSAGPLTISFNPGVTSVGANFFVTNGGFATVSGTITLTLSDGSSQSFYTTTANSFGGFVSHGAFISSITIATSNDFVTVDNLVVSTGTINACISEELNLTINHPSTTTETIVACGSYNWHGNTYTASNNTATWTGQNAAGCDSTVTLNLTINPLPTPAISGTLAFCAGGSTTLDAGAGYSSYLWSTGASTQTISVSSTTPVSVTVTNAAGCSATSASVTPVSNAVSTAPSSINSSVAFATAGVNFTLSVNGGSLGTGASWKWYTGSCGGTLIGTGASISVSQNANTTYFVRAEGTCNTTACAMIIVDSFCGATGVTSSAGTTAICAGSPVTLTVIGSLSPGAQWRWDDECDDSDADNDCSYSNAATFTVSPNSTKTYYVRSVGGACGLTACVPVTINVIAKPATPGTISGSASVCPSTSVTYTIAAVAGATSYTWTAPTNATLVSAQGGTSMTVAYASAFTSGTLKVKANNCSGSSSDKSRSIAKQAAPATPGNISGASAPCKGSTQTYSTSAVSGATSYTWTLPTGVSFVSGTSQTGTSIQVLVASTFNSGTLSVKANNCGGSSSNRTTTLTGQSAPTAPGTITGPSSVTQNTANNTFSVSNVAGMTYNWTVPAGCTITLGQGTSTIKVTWGTVAGNVSVTRNNGCGNSVASTKSVSVKRSEEAEADAGMEGARTEETVETLVTATEALNAIAVYPNPTTGEARITFNTTTTGKYSLSIVDLQGRVITSTSGAAIEGNNTLDINLSNCSNGVYMIHLMHNDTLQTLRVVKM
jgi:alpha-tubulin suppressor-like RCC1 family protein